jgi:UDP-4-amino-4,6-dideoxy-N-acetyl-beta-L-altrosamine transaminase
MVTVLPYGRQLIDDDDVAAVAAALRSDLLTTGPLVEKFEADLARMTGAAQAVVCNSGTAALHLATLALDLGPGDVAIVPSITFLATANAVRYTGADVVFADVGADSGLLTPEALKGALDQCAGRQVRAAFAVHLNGQLCDLKALVEICEPRGLTIVEDACHALGLPNVGAVAHGGLACFSTHPVKAIATGEGGFVTTGNAGLADRMRRLRSHGMERRPPALENLDDAFDAGVANPWYYEMPDIGWNYRLPDILCALGISQLRKLDEFFRRRVELALLYDELLAPLSPIVKPITRSHPHGWHLYAVLIDFSALHLSRRAVMEKLRSAGVGSQVHYYPVHRQPYYVELYGRPNLPGADHYYRRCLSIPLYPSMEHSDVIKVVAALTHIVQEHNRSC